MYGMTYEMLISRPSPHRPNEFRSRDVLKAGFLHHVFEKEARARFYATRDRRFEELAVEFVEGLVGVEGAVRGDQFEIIFDAFDHAAGFCVSEEAGILVPCRLG